MKSLKLTCELWFWSGQGRSVQSTAVLGPLL